VNVITINAKHSMKSCRCNKELSPAVMQGRNLLRGGHGAFESVCCDLLAGSVPACVAPMGYPCEGLNVLLAYLPHVLTRASRRCVNPPRWVLKTN
jgi:hypothetical protein